MVGGRGDTTTPVRYSEKCTLTTFMNKIKGGHQTSFTQQEVYFCQFIKEINGGCREGVPLLSR